MNNPKVILMHPGKQHSFRVASALKQSGLLYKYITTVYDKEDSIMMKLVKKFVNKGNQKRASNRKCEGLKDEDVVLFETFLSFLLLLATRLDKKKFLARKLNSIVSKRFQKKVANYAIEHNVDMVIGYDSNCRYCFEVLAKKAPHIKRVMDNAAPNRNYLCKVYTDNRDACGPFADALAPYKYLFDPENARWYSEEIKTVQYHIVASGFSKKALEYEGVSLDHIFVIPYGIDESRFMNIERTYEEGKLNLIFIGEVNQRKGIYQICEAAKKLNNPNIEFNIVGSGYEAQKELFAPYTKYVTFHGTAYFEKMQKHLEHNQVLLFPSMGDGFGFVVLEAMAAGMPVIASYNSAGPDVIKDGDNGFLIESCNTDALVDRVSWFLCNMDKVKSMGQRAQESAKCYTWDNYNTLIIESVKTILMQHE